MANKHVMDARNFRPGPPARPSNQQSWGPAPQKASNRPAAPRSSNRGGSQQRHREGRPRDVAQKAESFDDEEEEDDSYLILDAYQDDRKGVRCGSCAARTHPLGSSKREIVESFAELSLC